MFYIDPLYILFSLPAIILSVLASILLRYWNNKYINTPASTNLTGLEAVQKAAPSYNLNINLTRTEGYLSDHYNPSNDTLALSRDVAQKPSIASIAIATHELGHAQQDQTKNLLIGLRAFIVPVVNIGTTVGYGLIIMGIVLTLTNLAWIGVILFSFSTFFSLLTLPIEIDASRRALNMIREQHLLDNTEIGGAKKVLAAASLTYVAAAVASLANLAYFIFQVRGLSNRDN